MPQIEELEKRVHKGNFNVQEALREARSKINKIKDKELEDSAIFFCEWWAGKANRPTPKLVKMLKFKHAANFIPLMKEEMVMQVSLGEDSLQSISNPCLLTRKGEIKIKRE